MQPDVSKGRIMVVDDDNVIREILKKELDLQGYEVRDLADGRQAFSMAAEWRPDLILLDVILPGIKGTQICEGLRSHDSTRHIPVIMLTSLDRPTDIVAGLEAGAVDYICKPFNALELRARIATHIRTSRLIRQMVDLEKHLSLGRLTSGLCHEVNNPLTVVMGQLEMLGNEIKEPRPAKMVRLAYESSRRIQRLVQGLREYADPLVRSREACDINAVVEKAISIAALGWSRNPIQLEARLTSGLPRVSGDPEKLQQVFINILTNAHQVMPSGGVIVAETGLVHTSFGSQSIGTPSAGADWVFTRITDTGKGISEVNIPRIFDPFWTTKENWQSPGLGLSVARRIVDEHHGQIQVESKEGEGSTFKVLLPPETGLSAPA